MLGNKCRNVGRKMGIGEQENGRRWTDMCIYIYSNIAQTVCVCVCVNVSNYWKYMKLYWFLYPVMGKPKPRKRLRQSSSELFPLYELMLCLSKGKCHAPVRPTNRAVGLSALVQTVNFTDVLFWRPVIGILGY